MEDYIKSATAIFRIFTEPERYANENIRGKTEATLIWTIGYLFLLATLSYLFEGKNVSEVGRGGIVVLWTLSALTASGFLRFLWQGGDMTYGEASILYLTSLAIFLTAYVLAQLVTPYGHEPNAIVGIAAFGGAIYYFASPGPRMLAALAGERTIMGMRAFLAYFAISFIVWVIVAVLLIKFWAMTCPLGIFSANYHKNRRSHTFPRLATMTFRYIEAHRNVSIEP